MNEPIPMVLHCPACGLQHIDAPEVETVQASEGPPDGKETAVLWDNPPHRSHKCGSCGHIWRPADVPTVGVERIETKGKNDSAPVAPRGR